MDLSIHLGVTFREFILVFLSILLLQQRQSFLVLILREEAKDLLCALHIFLNDSHVVFEILHLLLLLVDG